MAQGPCVPVGGTAHTHRRLSPQMESLCLGASLPRFQIHSMSAPHLTQTPHSHSKLRRQKSWAPAGDMGLTRMGRWSSVGPGP